ncbi:MAG: hypothetical protein JXL67_10325, partial [Calditrichaeota bacterium]|nr:hypothetical protein [Calditrichota bacterium]
MTNLLLTKKEFDLNQLPKEARTIDLSEVYSDTLKSTMSGIIGICSITCYVYSDKSLLGGFGEADLCQKGEKECSGNFNASILISYIIIFT